MLIPETFPACHRYHTPYHHRCHPARAHVHYLTSVLFEGSVQSSCCSTDDKKIEAYVLLRSENHDFRHLSIPSITNHAKRTGDCADNRHAIHISAETSTRIRIAVAVEVSSPLPLRNARISTFSQDLVIKTIRIPAFQSLLYSAV